MCLQDQTCNSVHFTVGFDVFATQNIGIFNVIWSVGISEYKASIQILEYLYVGYTYPSGLPPDYLFT